MRLTAYTDYSLRVLLYLGQVEERLVTIDEIARSYRISSNHLMKITHHLGKLGYIETVRGRSGGMRLAGRPAEINIGGLIRHVEKDLFLVECMDPGHRGECLITDACRAQLIFSKAVQAFLDVLDSYTLADLLQNTTRLRTLLEIEEPVAGTGD